MSQKADPLLEEILEETKNPEEVSQEAQKEQEIEEESFETLLENTEISPQKQEVGVSETYQRENYVYDRLKKLEDILTLLAEKKNDFILIQPKENSVGVSMRKDGQEMESFEISYAVYNSSLFNAKKQVGLILEESTVEQE